jgi:hypothetical protein
MLTTRVVHAALRHLNDLVLITRLGRYRRFRASAIEA